MTKQWKAPLEKQRVMPGLKSEVTPFTFKSRLYLLENFKRAEDFPGTPLNARFHEDGFRIRDILADRILSIPLINHYFASAV